MKGWEFARDSVVVPNIMIPQESVYSTTLSNDTRRIFSGQGTRTDKAALRYKVAESIDDESVRTYLDAMKNSNQTQKIRKLVQFPATSPQNEKQPKTINTCIF